MSPAAIRRQLAAPLSVVACFVFVGLQAECTKAFAKCVLCPRQSGAARPLEQLQIIPVA